MKLKCVWLAIGNNDEIVNNICESNKELFAAGLVMLSLEWVEGQGNDYVFDLLHSFNPEVNIVIAPLAIKLNLLLMALGGQGTVLEIGHFLFRINPLKQLITGDLFWKAAMDNLKQLQNSVGGLNTVLSMDQEASKSRNVEKADKLVKVFNLTIEADNIDADKEEGNNDQTLSEDKNSMNKLTTSLRSEFVFHAQWQTPFTKEGSFVFGPPESSMKYDAIRLNTVQNVALGYSNQLQSTLIRVPFLGEKQSLVILLPYHTNNHHEVVLDGTSFTHYLERLHMINTVRLVNLTIPQFTIRQELNLNTVLAIHNLKVFNLMQAWEKLENVNLTLVSSIKIDEWGVSGSDSETSPRNGIKYNQEVPIPTSPLEIEVNSPFFYFVVSPISDNYEVLLAGCVTQPITN